MSINTAPADRALTRHGRMIQPKAAARIEAHAARSAFFKAGGMVKVYAPGTYHVVGMYRPAPFGALRWAESTDRY